MDVPKCANPGRVDSGVDSETPSAASILEAAIDRLTRAFATAPDDVIADLVSERKAMREELREIREGASGVVKLDAERARRGPKR